MIEKDDRESLLEYFLIMCLVSIIVVGILTLLRPQADAAYHTIMSFLTLNFGG